MKPVSAKGTPERVYGQRFW